MASLPIIDLSNKVNNVNKPKTIEQAANIETAIKALYCFQSISEDNVVAVQTLFGELLPNLFAADYCQRYLLEGAMHTKSMLLFQKSSNIVVGVSVWRRGGHIMSAAKMNITQRFPGGSTAHILAFGIRKSFRNTGLGSYLMKQTLLRMRNKAFFEQSQLHVVATNTPAIQLYEKFGFKKRLKKKGHYRTYVMTKKFAETKKKEDSCQTHQQH